MANEFFVTKVLCVDCNFEGTGIKSIQDSSDERCFSHWKDPFLEGPHGPSKKALLILPQGS